MKKLSKRAFERLAQVPAMDVVPPMNLHMALVMYIYINTVCICCRVSQQYIKTACTC